jgi:hypothetical protein
MAALLYCGKISIRDSTMQIQGAGIAPIKKPRDMIPGLVGIY